MEKYLEAIDIWVPKGVLILLVFSLSYVCYWLLSFLIKKTHREIMENFNSLGRNITNLMDSVGKINERLGCMVTIEQHKEAKNELKERINKMEYHFVKENKELKRRIELLETR